MPIRDQENSSNSKSMLWQLKLRLQFTGWLQYAPSLLVVVIFSLFTTLTSIIGYRHTILFNIFALLSFLFLINLFMEIITVKFALRPLESKRSTNIRNSSIFRIMRERRSCRSFQTQKLSQSDLHKLMQYAQAQTLSSSRLGERAIRFEYLCAPLTVWPVVNAKEFLVAIAPAQYHRAAVIDVGRCLQKIVLHATKMDIGTCWIGPGASHQSVITHLGSSKFNEDKDHIICVCAIGYQSAYEPLLMRVMRWLWSSNRFGRLPLPQLLFGNDMDRNASIVPLEEDLLCTEPLARFAACFEGCRWSPSAFNAQPTRCVVVTAENRVKRLDFYASTRSRYYAAVALGIWLAHFEMGCEELGIGGCFKRLELEEMECESATLIKHDMSWIVQE
eukprot:156568_1